jgi:tetratricopeptide (TPR) repeat protein
LLSCVLLTFLIFGGTGATASDAIRHGTVGSVVRNDAAEARYDRRVNDVARALTKADELIDRRDEASLRDAIAILNRARDSVGRSPQGQRHPRIEAAIARIAIVAGDPRRALRYVQPFVKDSPTGTTAAADPAGLDPYIASAWLISGKAQLLQVGLRPPELLGTHPTRPVPPDDRLGPAHASFFGVPIETSDTTPRLSQRERQLVQEALERLDWLAGIATGRVQIEAAEYCGSALALLGEYRKALDAYDFALHHIRHDEHVLPSDAKDHLLRRVQRQREETQRLFDVQRYSAEFVLYRQAEWLRRFRGEHAAAAERYLACIDAARATMATAAAPDGGDATFSGSVDAASSRGASPTSGVGTSGGESPFAAAATLYHALCLIEMGQEREAVRRLQAFIDRDERGLYRGEAMLELGRMALEREMDLRRAASWFERLDAWIVDARQADADWDFATILPGIRPDAKRLTDAPAQRTRTDFWGNVERTRIEPGQLVNHRTCTWYLDDLDIRAAQFRGFIHLARSEQDAALEQFRRLLTLDPHVSDGSLTHHPNDFTRLRFGVEHGYLIAYPDELKLYAKPLQQVILLADTYYVTQQYDRAASVYRAMLADRFGRLSAAQRHYPQYAVGLCLMRQGMRDRAFEAWEHVLASPVRTDTSFRAAYAIAHLSRYTPDAEKRKRGEALLVELALARTPTPYTTQARRVLLIDLHEQGRAREAGELRRRFASRDAELDQIAEHLNTHGGLVPPKRAIAEREPGDTDAAPQQKETEG